MSQNNIKITRVVSGENARLTATLELEVNLDDPEAVERFARLLRELIPEDERAQFVEDFQAAGREAGFEVAAG